MKTFKQLREATSISMKDIMRKHGRELKKVARSGNLELSDRAEQVGHRISLIASR